LDISIDGWRETLDINLTGAFMGAKHQIPAMLARGGGSIIFTSTFVGHTVAFPGMAAYPSAKAGLVGLTQVIAAEVGATSLSYLHVIENYAAAHSTQKLPEQR
jgi:NAD(P)-dependent dehydrogenase (short-subunit alcohol dehydrogenase family)